MLLCNTLAFLCVGLTLIPAGCESANQFVYKLARLCLKAEFVTYDRAGSKGNFNCAQSCLQHDDCRGFEFTRNPFPPLMHHTQCFLVRFSRCSHDMNWAGCTRTNAMINIRKIPGAPSDEICPIIFTDHFINRLSRMCVKPEFRQDVQARTEEICAILCHQQADCQGFYFSKDYFGRCGSFCYHFKFNRCSHDINMPGCTETASIWIRKISGVPEGGMCPNGFEHGHGTSYYKRIDARGSDWHRGKEFCATQRGLSKYADANDLAEITHFHWLMRNKFNRKSFFVGGRKISNGSYIWEDCQTPIKAEVWEPGQPDNKSPYTDVWIEYNYGLEDTVSPYYGIEYALCECVDPFKR